MQAAAVVLMGLIWQVAAPGPTGRVVESSSGRPIAGAEVSVVGRPGSTRTDADGRFVWLSPPVMPAVVVVTLQDGRMMRPVRVPSVAAGMPVTIAVEPLVHETMTVTGVSDVKETAPGAASFRIGRADLALRHPATLVQALEAVPGVSAIGEGQAAVPVIRGQARGRSLILVDGARATSERRAGANAAFVDPGTVRSIEILRGPGSVAYGSDAFGGVIAIRQHGPDRTEGWRGRLSGTFGAGVPERRGEIEVSRGYGSGAFLVGVRRRTFDDYKAPTGPVINSAWRDGGARLAWEQDLGPSRLGIRWQSDLGRDLGRPRSDSNVTRVTSPVDDSHRLTVSWEHPGTGALGHVRVDGLVGAASQRTDQDRLATATRPRSLESSESSYRDLQLRVVAERAAGRARLLGGVDLQGRYGLRTRDTMTNYDVTGAETSTTTSLSIDEANRTGLGVFVEASAPVTRRLSGTIGGRVDGVSNRNRGGFWGDRSIRSAAFAGVAALTAVPADAVSVTAQVARGFRDPTLSDRFYRGPVGRGIVEGNPDLAPETSLQIDLTTRIALGRLQTEVSAYRYRIVDLVERYPVNQALFRFRNRGDARFQGVEVAASVRLERGFGLEVAAQASRGQDGADGTPLDDVAPMAGSVVVRHAVSGRATSYLRVAVYGSHNAAGPSEVPTPAHELLDAGTSIRLTPALVVHATVRNLLGDAYYASAGPRWVFAPGRQVTLTASISF